MKLSSYLASATSICTLAGRANGAIVLDLNSDDSIKKAAATAAFDMMTYYTGNNTGDTPGNLPDPYYWWEAGAMFGTLINYWYYTGDTSYNKVIMQAMLHQTGENANFMPQNQTKTLGNDDQGFWGLAAMTAAETKFEDPPEGSPQWLALAQGVFNSQAARWDNSSCAGGLRWQIFSFNKGYNYKNSISNGCFFNLAARLALYTGNATYAEWADKSWTWMTTIGLISKDFEIFDGADLLLNCVKYDHTQWTYNTGIFIMGAAAMYNLTDGDSKWQARVDGMTLGSKKFFDKDIMYEPCETGVDNTANGQKDDYCNVDQRSFKAYFTRSLAATAILAPYTHENIMREIKTSVVAAVKTCKNGASGTQCGLRWNLPDNNTPLEGKRSLGVGEQMAVLELIQSNLVDQAPGFVSARAGTGTSKGDPNAGSVDSTKKDEEERERLYTKIDSGDRVGAGILTGLMILGVIAGTGTMIMSE